MIKDYMIKERDAINELINFDFDYEKVQAEYNRIHGGFETELLEASSELEGISSTLAREAMLSGKSLEGILPAKVIQYINER